MNTRGTKSANINAETDTAILRKSVKKLNIATKDPRKFHSADVCLQSRVHDRFFLLAKKDKNNILASKLKINEEVLKSKLLEPVIEDAKRKNKEMENKSKRKLKGNSSQSDLDQVNTNSQQNKPNQDESSQTQTQAQIQIQRINNIFTHTNANNNFQADLPFEAIDKSSKSKLIKERKFSINNNINTTKNTNDYYNEVEDIPTSTNNTEYLNTFRTINSILHNERVKVTDYYNQSNSNSISKTRLTNPRAQYSKRKTLNYQSDEDPAKISSKKKKSSRY